MRPTKRDVIAKNFTYELDKGPIHLKMMDYFFIFMALGRLYLPMCKLSAVMIHPSMNWAHQEVPSSTISRSVQASLFSLFETVSTLTVINFLQFFTLS